MLTNCSDIIHDPARLRAVAETLLMDTPLEEAFQRLNLLASMALKTPISIFSLIGEDRQYFKSAIGLPPEAGVGLSVPLNVSVCQYALQGRPLNLEDTKNHPDFKDNAAVIAMDIRGYLGIPLITKDGHAIGTVCVFDQKKRKWTEEEIAILQEITNSFLTEIELRRALHLSDLESKKKEEFLSIASHELNTPLSVLILQTQTAEKKIENGSFKEADQKKLFASFHRQFDRLQILVAEMLDLSRINSGQFTIRPGPCTLNHIVDDVLNTFSFQLTASETTVSFKADSVLSGVWDSFRIEQVLTNLISNVLKYAPGKPVNIHLRKDGGEVLLSVQDSGAGISPEDQEKVFLPFERLTSAASIKGLGVGLYISKKIMDTHKGDLRVSSKSGEGTTFTLVLPT